jgi:hypothetical protein
MRIEEDVEDLTEAQEQERLAIDAKLVGILEGIAAGASQADMEKELQAARLRMIAYARWCGGATYARIMGPDDDVQEGGNLIMLKRRNAWSAYRR